MQMKERSCVLGRLLIAGGRCFPVFRARLPLRNPCRLYTLVIAVHGVQQGLMQHEEGIICLLPGMLVHPDV
jgi:hypothetical protein